MVKQNIKKLIRERFGKIAITKKNAGTSFKQFLVFLKSYPHAHPLSDVSLHARTQLPIVLQLKNPYIKQIVILILFLTFMNPKNY